MESFKLTKHQLDQMMKQFYSERKQSLKTIKSFYSEIQAKQSNIFDTAIQRLEKNLHFFKQDKYKKMHNQIDIQAITRKYQNKLEKIENEISKLDLIIKNGCGKIVEKPITSRISINSKSGLNEDEERNSQKLGMKSHKNNYDGSDFQVQIINSKTSLDHYEQSKGTKNHRNTSGNKV